MIKIVNSRDEGTEAQERDEPKMVPI